MKDAFSSEPCERVPPSRQGSSWCRLVVMTETSERSILPFGSWPTPITSELVVRASVRLGGVSMDGADLWWAESRPEEGGRTVIVCNGVDVLAPPWNARTAVHEYGGGAWWVSSGILWFTDWADQCLYRVEPGGEPVAITAVPEVPRGDRYADGDVHPDGQSLVCVRERHLAAGGPADVVNEIVRMDTGGGEVEVLVSGSDFVSDPRWSRDGTRLCWLEWDHPSMPWDQTRLVVDGQHIAGGPGESISQPRWATDGQLWFLSDRAGWWNLYRWSGSGTAVEPVVLIDAEIGVPQWVFGQSRYDVLGDGRVVLAYQRDGFDHLALWDSATVTDVDVAVSVIYSIEASGTDVVFVGASPTSEAQLHRLRIDASSATVTAADVVRPARELGLDPLWFSVPEPIDFPSGDGRIAHGLYYAPTSADHVGPNDERPPLIVMIHGGPTAAARPMLDMSTQYWTSRGFAVVDVNYGGSTGYGREYRELLNEQWGVVDVEDCQSAARWLAQHDRVDPNRLCITGGSAGGFTTLAALAFGDTFAAGASHYGIADLEALATDTHKFESRYLDGLIGPYPARRDRYLERSPIHHLDGFDRPLIVLQGLDDEVVPPAQAEMIVNALIDKGVSVAYVPFAGEQHGFRQAPNMRRALDSELAFYAQVLHFELPAAEGIEPVHITN
jgi:dipeptidyl aminopeptidase/acylaminoacyl peptidase